MPGGIAIVFSFINSFFYSLEDSPLNSIYSIVVAIWASLFVIVTFHSPLTFFSIGRENVEVCLLSGTTITTSCRMMTCVKNSKALKELTLLAAELSLCLLRRKDLPGIFGR